MEEEADIGAIRMWCVDMALEICEEAKVGGDEKEIVKVAKEIEAYITEG